MQERQARGAVRGQVYAQLDAGGRLAVRRGRNQVGDRARRPLRHLCRSQVGVVRCASGHGPDFLQWNAV